MKRIVIYCITIAAFAFYTGACNGKDSDSNKSIGKNTVIKSGQKDAGLKSGKKNISLKSGARDAGLESSGMETGNKFRGRVINPAESFIELKKGDKEITLHYTESTQVLAKNGQPAGKDILEICQVAQAWYRVKDKKNMLLKIQIVKESDCKK